MYVWLPRLWQHVGAGVFGRAEGDGVHTGDGVFRLLPSPSVGGLSCVVRGDVFTRLGVESSIDFHEHAMPKFFEVTLKGELGHEASYSKTNDGPRSCTPCRR